MGFSASDAVPFTQERVKLSALADEVSAASEKINTKNDDRIHLRLLADAERGVANITADGAIGPLQQRRKAVVKASVPAMPSPNKRG